MKRQDELDSLAQCDASLVHTIERHRERWARSPSVFSRPSKTQAFTLHRRFPGKQVELGLAGAARLSRAADSALGQRPRPLQVPAAINKAAAPLSCGAPLQPMGGILGLEQVISGS